MPTAIQSLKRAIYFILWEHGGLTSIMALALYLRLWLLAWWKTFPFGDVFNYVHIAQSLAHFNYPIYEKRLPFYPFLILIFHSLVPKISWENSAIAIAVAMSLVALILLYAIARSLKLSKTAALVGVLIYMSYQPFLAYSIRGYADSTFIVLILAGILAALHIKTRTGQIAVALIAGLLPLTRYEGALVSILLGLYTLWQLRYEWRKIILMLIIFILIIAPYIFLAWHSGRSLLPEAYLSQAGHEDQGYGATSLQEWQERYHSIWTRLGLFTVWYIPRNLWSAFREDPLGWHQQVVDQLVEPRYAIALLAIPGTIFLLIYRRSVKLLIVSLPFFAIAAASAWWAPLIRYDAMIFPFIILLGVAGLHSILQLIRTTSTTLSGKIVYRGFIIITLFIATAVWMLNLTQDTQQTLRKSRFRALAFYEAFKVIRYIPDRVIFENDEYIIDTYFGERAVYSQRIFKPNDTVAEHWQKLKESKAHYILASDAESSRFSFLNEPFPHTDIQKIAHYKIEQGNNDIDEWSVYKINKLP